MWKAFGRAVGGRCQANCAWQRPPTTRRIAFHIWKTRGCQCSFRPLMMGGVSPETCWASYKYGIIKILIHCCNLLDFFFMNYGLKFCRQLCVSTDTVAVTVDTEQLNLQKHCCYNLISISAWVYSKTNCSCIPTEYNVLQSCSITKQSDAVRAMWFLSYRHEFNRKQNNI
jgi:hypothetical protein